MAIQLIVGFLMGIIIAILAGKAGTLNRSGMLVAVLSGGLIFGLGGVKWAMLLLTFFISSSALSRAFSRRKALMSEKFSKGSQRDWGQVLANGGLGAVLVVIQAFLPDQTWPWLAYVGSMAAVNADTWATELGVLSQQPPRLITSCQLVERGTSGAISLPGSMAALAGASLIGLAAGIFSIDTGFLLVLGAAMLGGMAGSFFDSLLGATIQAIYTCPACKKETERYPLHTCGTPTLLLRGWRWLNNDWVNFACSLVGAIIAMVISSI